jgi:Protein of unknown function (DUF4065)
MPRYPNLNTAIHYIVSRCPPEQLGATKLNKILWYSDIAYYERTGASITGDEYVKQQFGPVPKHTLPATRDLENERAIVSRNASYFGMTKKEYWSLREPDISKCDPVAISIMDQTIEWICNEHTARSISEETHDLLWESAELGEVIPFGAALAYRAAEITKDDLDWAEAELAKAE